MLVLLPLHLSSFACTQPEASFGYFASVTSQPKVAAAGLQWQRQDCSRSATGHRITWQQRQLLSCSSLSVGGLLLCLRLCRCLAVYELSCQWHVPVQQEGGGGSKGHCWRQASQRQ